MSEAVPRISIALSQEIYHETDHVSGVASFTHSDASESWMIEVTATEKVAWTESVSFAVQGFTQTYIENLHGLTNIAQASVIVHKPIDVTAGFRYRVPFSFTLPARIPGSCSHIHYVVRARIQSDTTTRAEVPVAAAGFKVIQSAPLASRLQLKTDSAVRVFFCCNRGSLVSRFVLDRSWYSPGDIVKLSSQVRNQTKSEITGVSIALKSVERFVSDGGIRKDTDTLVFKEQFSQIDASISVVIPSHLSQSVFGTSYRFMYVLDIHVELSRGSSHTLRLPLIVLPARADEAPPVSPSVEGIETPHVSLVLDSRPAAAFHISEFPNVSEFSELGRSTSRLSRSWSSIKSLVRVGSKFITGH